MDEAAEGDAIVVVVPVLSAVVRVLWAGSPWLELDDVVRLGWSGAAQHQTSDKPPEAIRPVRERRSLRIVPMTGLMV